MLVLAVTIHNIPEGMAVGAVYAGWIAEDSVITVTAALALSVESPFRIFRRARLSPCRCGRKM